MKNLLLSAAIGLAAILHGAAATFDIPTQSPSTVRVATNLAATVATGAISNQTSRIPIVQGKGLIVEWGFNVSSGTSNAVMNLYPTIDRTNVWTTPLFQITSTAAGTTAVTNGAVFRADQLVGIRELQIGLTNQNAGTLTNKGVRWSIPN